MGIDVASFGDFFADNRYPKGRTQNITAAAGVHPNGSAKQNGNGQAALEIAFEEESKKPQAEAATKIEQESVKTNGAASNGKRSSRKGGASGQPINCLIYKDPFSATYKKYIFTEDGKYLLGGMMVGDVSDFVKLVAIVKKKVSWCANTSTKADRSPSESARCPSVAVHRREQAGRRRWR